MSDDLDLENQPSSAYGSHSEIDDDSKQKEIVSNHTGYDHGENFEHDDTGAIANYSGVEDDINNAVKEHEGWELGYDF